MSSAEQSPDHYLPLAKRSVSYENRSVGQFFLFLARDPAFVPFCACHGV